MGKNKTPDVDALFSQSGLSSSAREFLSTHFRLFQFDQGQKVIEKGKRGQFLAVIAQGQVEVEDETGRKRALKRGESFGEEMLHIGAPSLITAITRTRAQLWVLTRKDFLAAEQIEDTPTQIKKKSNRLRNWALFLILIVALVAGLFFLSPELPDAIHFYMTSTLLDINRPDLAETYLFEITKIQPDTASVFDQLGYVLFQEGKNQQALGAFERAVQLDEESASAQNNLGVLLINMAQLEKAIEHLEKARELDPGNAEVYFNLGNAYLSTGDETSALNAYHRSVEMSPTNIDARVQIARILTENGELNPAKTIWQEILDLQQDNLQAKRGLGIIAVKEGSYKEAYHLLYEATLTDPGDAAGHFYLGLAFEGLQMYDEAARRFEIVQMLSDDPVLLEQAKLHLQAIGQ